MLCRIGEVEVWRILEINGPFKSPEELFPGAGVEVRHAIEEEVPHQLCPNSGMLVLPIQGFLLKTPAHNILVDSCVGNDKTNPGMPAWHRRSDERFMSALAAAGIGPQDIDYVLCTHLHSDHIGWNTRLMDGRWVPTFANARYVMPSADEDFYRENPGNSYNESVLPVIEAGQVDLVGEGHKLGDHVTLIPTPGHTPGHVSILVESGSSQAIITGDAMHTSVQCRHPEWHFLYDEDGELASTLRVRLLEIAAETNSRVLGSHFALPSIGRVRVEGENFRWEDDDA